VWEVDFATFYLFLDLGRLDLDRFVDFDLGDIFVNFKIFFKSTVSAHLI